MRSQLNLLSSELGRNYLRARQDEKRAIIAELALKPKQIATCWKQWGPDRPADAACIDELVLKFGFTGGGARDFLKVYDATVSFAKPAIVAKIMRHKVISNEDDFEVLDRPPDRDQPIHRPDAHQMTLKLMDSERQLTAGLLSKDASFRLIVSGDIGVKEIERLIQKLEIDKEILADVDEEPESE
jgi:hypothetical protein